MFKAILVTGIDLEQFFVFHQPGFWEVTKPPNENFGQFWERTSITYFFPVFVPSPPPTPIPPFYFISLLVPPHFSVYIHMSM